MSFFNYLTPKLVKKYSKDIYGENNSHVDADDLENWQRETAEKQNEMDRRTKQTKFSRTTSDYKYFYEHCGKNPDCYAVCAYKSGDTAKKNCAIEYEKGREIAPAITKANRHLLLGGLKQLRKKILKRKNTFKKNKRSKKRIKRIKTLKRKINL